MIFKIFDVCLRVWPSPSLPSCQDKAVLIVDVTSGAVRARLLGHTSEVNALAWSQCQEGLLASCSDDGIKVTIVL